MNYPGNASGPQSLGCWVIYKTEFRGEKGEERLRKNWGNIEEMLRKSCGKAR